LNEEDEKMTTSMLRNRAVYLLAFAIGATAGLSCRSRNEAHCSLNEGNATCLERHPDGSLPYCTTSCMPTPKNDGCTAERPSDDACYSPCGGDMTVDECEDVAEDSSSGDGSESVGEATMGTSTGVDEATDGEETQTSETDAPCADDDECGGGAPFCGPAGICVGCDGMDDPDAACEGAGAALPLCFEGACVACTAESAGACGGTTPVCDEDTLSCKACAYHFECPDSACNALTGACLDAPQVDVGPGQTFTTIAAALSSVGADEEAVFVVRNNTGNDPYFGSLATIGGGRVVALLTAEGNRPRVTGDGSPTFAVDGATLLIDGLAVRGNGSGLGVRVTGGGLVLDRTEVVDNSHGGIEVLASSEALLRNVLVGGDRNDAHALDVRASTAVVVYATLATGFGNGSALFCNAQASVDVRNGILLNRDSTTPEVQCAGASIENSATEADVDNLVTGWFVNWADANLRLSTAGPTPGAPLFANIARWETGDPPTDIGNAAGTAHTNRPNTDGASDFAGAHIPN
jgi:hypothetical protein